MNRFVVNFKHIIMKTSKTLGNKKTTLLAFSLFITLFLFSYSVNAQIQVKGIVKGKTDSEIETLNGANIYLMNKKVATISNRKGEFTFPKKLNNGDILVFSYLGFVTQKITINANSSYLTVILNEDENQMLGALNTNKPYKSKAQKKQ